MESDATKSAITGKFLHRLQVPALLEPPKQRGNDEHELSRTSAPSRVPCSAIYATSSAHQKLPLRLLEGSCCALVSFGTRTSGTMCPELFINEPAEQVSKCRLIVI